MNYIDRIVSQIMGKRFIQDHWMQTIKLKNFSKLVSEAGIGSLTEIVQDYASNTIDDMRVVLRGKGAALRGEIEKKKVQDTQEYALKRAKQRTMILYRFDKHNQFYGELVSKLASRIEFQYVVTAFMAMGQTGGVAIHGDQEHGLVFQHSGKSRWRVFDWNGKLVFDHVLIPGQFLYIPPLFKHVVERQTKQTLHVTIVLYPKLYTHAQQVIRANYKCICLNSVLRHALPDGPEGDKLVQMLMEMAAEVEV